MDLGVEVSRPHPRDFSQGGGMYLVVGDTVVIPKMMMPIRNFEVQCLDFVLHRAKRVMVMPEQPGITLDAANVCRINDTLLVLESASGSIGAIDWLKDQFPHHRVESCNFYSGAHIDSTIVPLREGLVLLNASRVNKDNCPRVFSGWQKIWVNEVVERSFYQYPYASKWIGINMLVVRPDLVIVDALQTGIMDQLRQHGIESIPMHLTHSRTLGGGFHCVTLDLHRQN
jgi:glycine amidinotransferase/scyllo-inosamine-4-phosphate amidinotransferase 1